MPKFSVIKGQDSYVYYETIVEAASAEEALEKTTQWPHRDECEWRPTGNVVEFDHSDVFPDEITELDPAGDPDHEELGVYQIDLKVAATAYIKANSPREARKIAEEHFKNAVLTLPGGDNGEIEVSECQFDDPDLPDVSISPVMTINGPYEGWPGLTESLEEETSK